MTIHDTNTSSFKTAYYDLCLVPKSRMAQLYFHFATSQWHSAYLITGTTYTFSFFLEVISNTDKVKGKVVPVINQLLSSI